MAASSVVNNSPEINSRQSVTRSVDKGNRDIRLVRMMEEITGKIMGPMPARLFLEKYISQTNVGWSTWDLSRFRAEIQKLASITVEEHMYATFIQSAVQPLCPSLHLRDTHTEVMKAFHKIAIGPDLCAYTDIIDLTLNDPTRPDIMMEFKVDHGLDPFVDQGDGFAKALLRNTGKANETLGQITSYAAAQLSAQFRTHIFSLLVFPSYFRLLRWDRSGVIVTEKIKLTDSLLPEFLHRYSHSTPEKRGVDVSVTEPSPADAAAAREALDLSVSAALVQVSVSADKGGYIFSRDIYMNLNKSPVGRSTRAYRAYSIDHKAVVFLKDAWRLASQKPEHEIYAQLHEKEVPYIATVIDGADIMDHVTHTQDLVKEAPLWAIDRPVCLPKHVHYRLVLKEVASSLTTFSSTKQLVQVIRQAIIAHQKAYEDTGILHRDISINNIMIYNDQALLIDWDLSKSIDDDQRSRELQRTGTWQFMAARLLRESVKGPHNLTDDLESFLHVLTWVAFGYTNHELPPQRLTAFLRSTYDYSYRGDNDKHFGGQGKIYHLLTGDMLEVIENANFAGKNLLELFMTLTERFAIRYLKAPLWARKFARDTARNDDAMNEYQAELESIANSKWMIGKFDECLAMGNWPENDAAVKHSALVEQTEITTTSVQSTNSRKRPWDDVDDGSRKRLKSSTSCSIGSHTLVDNGFH